MDKELISLINAHIDQIKQANQGRKRDGQIFKGAMENLAQLIVSDFDRYAYFSSLCHKALQSGRDGKIVYADRLLNKAILYINQCDKLERKFFQIWYSPIKAFMLYKNGNYSKAVQFTLQTMKIDDEFESIHSEIFFHKIQQLQNIARVESKRDLVKSAKIYDKLYQSLSLKEEIEYEGINLDIGKHLGKNNTKGLRHLMFLQALEENIYFLDKIEAEAQSNKFFLNSFASFLKPTEKRNDSELFYWVQIKKTFLERKYLDKKLLKKYFSKVTEFSSTYPANSLLSTIKKMTPMTAVT